MEEYPDAVTRNVTVDPSHYAMVPEALIYSGLSDKAVRVYAALLRHGDDPRDCYPSKRRIGELIGCAPASLARPIRELETAGWIRRIQRVDQFGTPTSNAYFVHRTPRTSSAGPAQESTDDVCAAAGDTSAVERAEREPVNESNLNEKETLQLVEPEAALDYGEVFERFWAAYPRKVGKPTARRAWDRALGLGDRKGRTTIEDVRAGLGRWLAYWRDAGTAPEFIPHAATWLNQDRYNDEPATGRPVKGPRWSPDDVEDAMTRERPSGKVEEL